MARPAEKARSMLNKWVAMREAGNRTVSGLGKRPVMASECNSLQEAQRFRNQVLREIREDVARIQNPAMIDSEVRDLNDKINRLMREKHHWTKRVLQLGGRDYAAIEKQKLIEDGQEIPIPGQYQYFGAARNLPGVEELLAEREAKKLKKKKAQHIYPDVTPDYWGWRDEEDEAILRTENEATDRLMEGHTLDYNPPFTYLDDVPTNEEVYQQLIDERKQELMKKYNIG